MARTKRHVRRADLPWRALNLTECGRPTVGGELGRREAVVALRAHDVARFAASKAEAPPPATDICQTCAQHMGGSTSWSRNPAGVIHREIERNSLQWAHIGSEPAGNLLTIELRAIAALIAAHPEEFAELTGGPVFNEAWQAFAAYLAKQGRGRRS